MNVGIIGYGKMGKIRYKTINEMNIDNKPVQAINFIGVELKDKIASIANYNLCDSL